MFTALLLGIVSACFTTDDTTCSSCVKQSNETSLCVWCYDDEECREWTNSIPCSNNSDVSFGGEQCECRPGAEQSCDSCTHKQNCVWLDDSEIEVTTIVYIGNKAVVDSFALNSGASCWAGDMFS